MLGCGWDYRTGCLSTVQVLRTNAYKFVCAQLVWRHALVAKSSKFSWLAYSGEFLWVAVARCHTAVGLPTVYTVATCRDNHVYSFYGGPLVNKT